jgi:hypothetical protein
MDTVFDFAPLWRSGVGFDRLFDVVEQALKFEPTDNFPPYDKPRRIAVVTGSEPLAIEQKQAA